MQTQIRTAHPHEAAFLSDLSFRSKSHWPYDPDYLALCRSATHVVSEDIQLWHFRVAEVDGIVRGFSAVCPVKGEYMLDHLWIDPMMIGKGLGQKLFLASATDARAMGWRKFLIASDPYAEKFYLRMGAKRVGQRESKIKPGFFLPLLEYDLGLTLIGDQKVIQTPVQECGEPLVDLQSSFPDLLFDLERHHVQKNSKTISVARTRIGEMLLQAQGSLPKNVRLLLKECHRPMWVQKSFWHGYSNFLRKKFPDWNEEQIYEECSKLNAPLAVAPHTTGGAVDLTLTDSTGQVLDMGTEFNASPLTTQQGTYTDASNISEEARANRQLLFRVMSKAGFVNYPTEWWHWSFGDKYWAYVTGAGAALYDSVAIEETP